jgi:hypothetical protein
MLVPVTVPITSLSPNLETIRDVHEVRIREGRWVNGKAERLVPVDTSGYSSMHQIPCFLAFINLLPQLK